MRFILLSRFTFIVLHVIIIVLPSEYDPRLSLILIQSIFNLMSGILTLIHVCIPGTYNTTEMDQFTSRPYPSHTLKFRTEKYLNPWSKSHHETKL
jgi:hypothetical protein